jgi:predicted nucleic-acid-binding protein
MKVIADTNILLRHILHDDPRQARIVGELLQDAELIAIPVSVLCEFVWVLRQGYKKSRVEVATATRALMETSNIVLNDSAVNAGLELLDSRGDFADGVIAYEGARLGADEFVSFDKQAVKLIKAQGKRARLLS